MQSANTDLDLAVLGELRVRRGGVPVRLGPRQSELLCALLVEAGRLVPTRRLVELLWDAPLPAGATATLRSHVSHLRKALERPWVLVTAGTGGGRGYRLNVEPEQIDACRFERDCFEGQRLVMMGEPARGATLISDALRLWRGPAFADVADRPFAVAEIARLDALRRSVRGVYAEALLRLGRYTEVAGTLAGAVADEPYDERLRRLLALALYHQRRVDEAAALCREGVTLLRLRGLDAPELQDLQRAILSRTLPVGVS